MPKLKTKRGVRRRFKITATGKVMAYRAGKIHLKRKKSSVRKRRLRQKQVLCTSDARKAKKMLPYG